MKRMAQMAKAMRITKRNAGQRISPLHKILEMKDYVDEVYGARTFDKAMGMEIETLAVKFTM